MDREIIGRRAVEAVNRICYSDMDDRLEPKIPVSDKDISYDGGIEVFTQGRRMKTSFLYKIPVQVKGTMVKNFSGNSFKYRKINREDLEVYLRGNGVLFFVVQEHHKDRNQNKVFIYPLLPTKIIELLNRNQKTYTLNFSHLPDDSSTLFTFCKFFKENSDKQSQVNSPHFFKNTDIRGAIDKKLPLKMSVIGPPTKEAFFSAFNQIYISDQGMDRPINNFDITSIIFKEYMEFTHEGISYVLDKQIIEFENKTQVILNNVFHVIIKPNDIDLIIEIKSSSLSEKKITLLFLKELDKIEKDKTVFKEIISYLESVIKNHQKIYSFFSLDENKTINLAKDDETIPRLLYFISASEGLFRQLKSDGFYSLPFADIYLIVCVDLDKKTVFPAFSGEIESIEGVFINDNISEKPLGISLYYALFQESNPDSKTYEDLDSARIIRSFKHHSNFSDDNLSPIINCVVLNCLLRYDLSNDIKYLEIAEGLSIELQSKNPDNLSYIINKAQVEYRKNDSELTYNTQEHLIDLRLACSENQTLQLAISILLNDYITAKSLYSRLEKKYQNRFSQLPIFNLFKIP